MDYINSKSIITLLLVAKPIGFGVDSVCFLLPNNEVLKIFKNNSRTKLLLSEKNNGVTFEQKLIKIGLISNDVFVGPKKIQYVNGQLVGYYMKYISDTSLEKTSSSIRLSRLFYGYSKMLYDLREISNKHFELFDIKCNSVYLDRYYKISDLDRCKFVFDKDIEDIYQRNARIFLNTIIWKIFKIKDDEYPLFEDDEVYKMIFNKTSASSPEAIEDLKKFFMSRCECYDPTIDEIREKIKVKGYYNSYLN